MKNKLTDVLRFQLQEYLERRQAELERNGKVDLERLAQESQRELGIPITPGNITGALRVSGTLISDDARFPKYGKLKGSWLNTNESCGSCAKSLATRGLSSREYWL